MAIGERQPADHPMFSTVIGFLEQNGGTVVMSLDDWSVHLGIERTKIHRFLTALKNYEVVSIQARREFGKGALPGVYKLLIPIGTWERDRFEILERYHARRKAYSTWVKDQMRRPVVAEPVLPPELSAELEAATNVIALHAAALDEASVAAEGMRMELLLGRIAADVDDDEVWVWGEAFASETLERLFSEDLVV